MDLGPQKDHANRREHGLSFATAEHVFHDPLAVSCRDPSTHEERWQTIGMVAGTIILVVHTEPDAVDDADPVPGRIISARKATRRERQAYEEGEID